MQTLIVTIAWLCASEVKVEKKTRSGMKCINVDMLKEEEIHEWYIMELAQCYGQQNHRRASMTEQTRLQMLRGSGRTWQRK